MNKLSPEEILESIQVEDKEETKRKIKDISWICSRSRKDISYVRFGT